MDRVRGLERRDDPLEPREQLERLERLGVGRRDVLDALRVLPPAVLGADAGVVEARAARVHVGGLPVLVLQHVAHRAVQHARRAERERSRVVAGRRAASARLDADEAHRGVGHEGMEHARRVRAAADARDDRVRQPPELLEALRAALAADHALEVAHHHRERVRPDHRADDVVRLADRAHPVAHRLVGGVLERPRARVDLDHLRAHELHAEDIEVLPPHILAAHVDAALDAEARARGRGGDAVLAGAGLGDDARLAHALREERLAERVVDLVRAGVREVLALEPDLRAARVRREPRRGRELRRAPDELAQQPVDLAEERGVRPRLAVGGVELLERREERLGDIAPAERPEAALRIGNGAEVDGGHGAVLGVGTVRRRVAWSPACLPPRPRACPRIWRGGRAPSPAPRARTARSRRRATRATTTSR